MVYEELVRVYWSQFRVVRFHQRLPHDSCDYLVVPKDFVKHVKGKLPEMATLITNKSKWDVKLEFDGDSSVLLLTDGWKEFANAHFLKENDLVIFKHLGAFQFKVSMYDGQTGGQNPATFYVCQNSSESESKGKDRVDRTTKRNVERDHSGSDDGSNCSSEAASKKAKQACGDKRGSGVNDETMKYWTLQKANEMKNDDEAVVYMSPSCVGEKGYAAGLNTSWAKDHGLDRTQYVELHCNGNVRRVKFYLGGQEGQVAALRSGWKQFAVENGLKLGDACLFSVLPRSVRGSGGCVCVGVRIVKGESESED